jgi:hypothetical protein
MVVLSDKFREIAFMQAAATPAEGLLISQALEAELDELDDEDRDFAREATRELNFGKLLTRCVYVAHLWMCACGFPSANVHGWTSRLGVVCVLCVLRVRVCAQCVIVFEHACVRVSVRRMAVAARFKLAREATGGAESFERIHSLERHVSMALGAAVTPVLEEAAQSLSDP